MIDNSSDLFHAITRDIVKIRMLENFMLISPLLLPFGFSKGFMFLLLTAVFQFSSIYIYIYIIYTYMLCVCPVCVCMYACVCMCVLRVLRVLYVCERVCGSMCV